MQAFQQTQIGPSVVIHHSLELGGDGDVEIGGEAGFELSAGELSRLQFSIGE